MARGCLWRGRDKNTLKNNSLVSGPILQSLVSSHARVSGLQSSHWSVQTLVFSPVTGLSSLWSLVQSLVCLVSGCLVSCLQSSLWCLVAGLQSSFGLTSLRMVQSLVSSLQSCSSLWILSNLWCLVACLQSCSGLSSLYSLVSVMLQSQVLVQEQPLTDSARLPFSCSTLLILHLSAQKSISACSMSLHVSLLHEFTCQLAP